MSSENSSSGCLEKLGRQQIGERHRDTACCSCTGSGPKRGRGESAVAPTVELPWIGGDDAEVGTRADDDDGAAGRNRRRNCGAEPTSRRVGAVQGDDVVGADHDDCCIRRRPRPRRSHRSGPGTILRRGAQNRLGAQVDPADPIPRRGCAYDTWGHLFGGAAAWIWLSESPKIIRCRSNGTAVPLLRPGVPPPASRRRRPGGGTSQDFGMMRRAGWAVPLEQVAGSRHMREPSQRVWPLLRGRWSTDAGRISTPRTDRPLRCSRGGDGGSGDHAVSIW